MGEGAERNDPIPDVDTVPTAEIEFAVGVGTFAALDGATTAGTVVAGAGAGLGDAAGVFVAAGGRWSAFAVATGAAADNVAALAAAGAVDA